MLLLIDLRAPVETFTNECLKAQQASSGKVYQLIQSEQKNGEFTMYQDLLLTMGEVACTLIGFVGVVMYLGDRDNDGLSNKDRDGLFHLLYGAIGALLASFFMVAVQEATSDSPTSWRVGCAVMAIYSLIGILMAASAGAKNEHSDTGINTFYLPPITISIILVNIAAAAGMTGVYSSLIFVFGVIWLLIISLVYFIPFILTRTPGHK